MTRNRKAMAPAERFWPKVKKLDGGCWLWQSCTNSDGYGVLSMPGGKVMAAHRLSWSLHNGAIPSGLWVLHKCDVPSCVNPDHLFLGTHLENIKDRNNKNRQASGRKINHAKLSMDEAKTIRHLYWAERRSPTELSKFFRVSDSTIYQCVHRKTWNNHQYGGANG